MLRLLQATELSSISCVNRGKTSQGVKAGVVSAPYASAGIMATATKLPTFVLWCSHLHLVGHLHPISANTGRTIIGFHPIGAIPEAGAV